MNTVLNAKCVSTGGTLKFSDRVGSNAQPSETSKRTSLTRALGRPVRSPPMARCRGMGRVLIHGLISHHGSGPHSASSIENFCYAGAGWINESRSCKA